MYSIMDAVEAAQRRAEERDVLNAQREPMSFTSSVAPNDGILPLLIPEGGGEDPYVRDTRTEIEKYNDLIAANKVAPFVPIVGTGLGLYNDYQIDKMERENPRLRPENPFSKQARERFSYAGRVQGYGYPQQNGKFHTTIWDRITGNDPTWAESMARTNYPIPTDRRNFNNDEGGGGIGGYSRESLSYENPNPEDRYGYA